MIPGPLWLLRVAAWFLQKRENSPEEVQRTMISAYLENKNLG